MQQTLPHFRYTWLVAAWAKGFNVAAVTVTVTVETVTVTEVMEAVTVVI